MSANSPSPRKPPTLQELAESLGMHKSTVSLALSGKGNISAVTRARVQAAARELGYEPNPLAQRLARGDRSEMVSLFTGTLDAGLTAEKLLRIQELLSARGLEVPIFIYSQGPDRGPLVSQVRELRRQRPRLIVCASHRVEAPVFAELEAYQREGGVVVSYDTPIPLACDQVVFNREENAYRAARHLLELGHRRIGIGISSVSGTPTLVSDPVNARLRGFRRALEEFGAPVRDDWFFRNANYEEGGAQMARRFLALEERPTALCVVNDYVALAFMIEVQRAGVRIPEDVSLIGHDNQPIAAYCPVPLTAMTQPADQISAAVANLVLDRIEGRAPDGAPPRTIHIAGELVGRASTTRPNTLK